MGARPDLDAAIGDETEHRAVSDVVGAVFFEWHLSAGEGGGEAEEKGADDHEFKSGFICGQKVG